MPTSLNTLDLEVKSGLMPIPPSGYRGSMGSADPTRKQLGARLKAARLRRDMTQQFVADLFEVDKGTVSAWETGGGDPGVYRLRRLAKLYDATADSLLWDSTVSPEAAKIASQYDKLSSEQKEKFASMWKTYFAEEPPEASYRQVTITRPREEAKTDPLLDTWQGLKASKSRNAAKKRKAR